jgi:putative peptidoglycan lipid II flippase
MQVLAATALLAVYLTWASHSFAWVEMRARPMARVGLLAALLAGAAVLYFGALWASGVKLRQFASR